ncbi:hypothetical protein ASD01_18615 [Ensifer sp. Root423]|nr:hypothetical protein FA04_16995 [Ensifer adhaerens]KQX02746.1 hypothetical protein ASD01_18615 [Ensifer sp. Root423]
MSTPFEASSKPDMARTPLLFCEVSVRIRPKLAIQDLGLQDLAFTRRVFETACAKTQHSTYQQAR